MERSPVFEAIVLDENDIDGLVAYSLYKRHKRAWCVQFEADHGKHPTPKEKLRFARGQCTQDQLERYRKDAQDVLIAYAEEYVEDATPEIRDGAISTRIEKAAGAIERQGSFGSQLWLGFISSLINTGVLLLLAVGISLFGIDLVDGILKLLSK